MTLSRLMHEFKQSDTWRFAVAANRPSAPQPIAISSRIRNVRLDHSGSLKMEFVWRSQCALCVEIADHWLRRHSVLMLDLGESASSGQ